MGDEGGVVTHRPNPGLYRDVKPQVAVIDSRYQAEIDKTMARAEKAWQQATAALAKAVRRADKRAGDLEARRLLKEAEQAVGERLAELRDVQRLMEQPVRGNNWSGAGSVRFVPKGHRGL